MYIINNKQFNEIYKAAKGGDVKAKAIIDKYSQGDDYDAVKRLVDDYYGNGEESEPVHETEVVQETEPTQETDEDSITGIDQAEKAEEALDGGDAEENIAPQAVDITELLDRETDGLVDDDDIKDMSFEEFMDKKRRDANRAKKNHDYFSAFDPEGKAAYLQKKEDDYGHSFDIRRKDIERNHRDMDGAISAYAQMVGDQPDDGIKTDMGVVDKAYGDIVDTVGKSHSFGRSWDEDDMNEVKEQLMGLMQQYGRSNVIAALNILKGDNDAYRDHRNNCIDKAIKDHNGKWEELLK
jgi:hypothetical protein